MPTTDFNSLFAQLTGTSPFPWQSALYERFCIDDLPSFANIPTGLGKTSIVAIWLIALARHPNRVPRRLVYVVNRRTVVDQTTAEAARLCKALSKPELAEVRDSLASLCALPLPTPDAPPLAISTLRGQYADNGEWCADPSRPAIVVGTVDMIGSGLLFSRYTRGFKARPLHAGFLGQDVMLVHDEAHLEPAFQTLLEAISTTQASDGDQRKMRVLELTATSRAVDTTTDKRPFGLDENPNDRDTDNETVKKRINAVKRLSLVPVTKIDGGKDKANDGTVRDKILEYALSKKKSHRAVLVFVRTVDAAIKITDALNRNKCAVVTLTGTMRGKERDKLVSEDPVFQRFLPNKDRADGVTPAPGTAFLVATSAGEVGVNISADDLVCDLTTYESMAQRFGRINRFGDRDDSEIVVIYRENLQASYDDGLEKAKSAKKDRDKKIAAYQQKNQSDLRIIKTLGLLHKLGDSARPAALNGLSAAERTAAFSPPPKIRVATEVQFDAWALTSVRKPIAARPPITPYLHGEVEWQRPETHVAWREELDVLNTPELREAYPPSELLEDYPLKPLELLRDSSERIHDQLICLLGKFQANRTPLPPSWIVHENGDTEFFPLARLLTDQETDDDEGEEDEAEEGTSDAQKAEKARRKRAVALIANATLILPASLGGIEKGLFTAYAVSCDKADVADVPDQRRRVWSDSAEIPADLSAAGFRLIRIIDKRISDEETDDSVENTNRFWLWLEAKPGAIKGARLNPAIAETLHDHTAAVTANATAIAAKLLPDKSKLATGEPDLRRCIILAARMHDLGKNRAQWQRNLGNFAYDCTKPETILAKSAPGMRPRTVVEHYRHEFGSLNDASAHAEFATLSDAERDIVLHIVAAHHGRARPHFPADEIGDNATTPEADAILATEIPRRFARLQKRFGRWGLAWLESLLRAADYAASAGIVAPPSHEEPANDACGDAHPQTASARITTIIAQPIPTATLDVNPANPGHYFACCGLFELASRLSPATHAWFATDSATRQWRFHMASTPTLAEILEKLTSTEIVSSDAPEDDDEDADEDTADDEEKDASAPPLYLESPFDLRLDWWTTATAKTSALKVWAGSMKVHNIARSMSFAIQQPLRSHMHSSDNILTDFQVTYDLAKLEKRRRRIEQTYKSSLKKAEEKHAQALVTAEAKELGQKLEREKVKIAHNLEKDVMKVKSNRDRDLTNITTKAKKIEPFYFDANRGPNAHSRDVGFATNDLKLQTLAAPAVELLTLVGLQRATPAPAPNAPRNFDYHLWTRPLPISFLTTAVNGLLPDNVRDTFRFESWFRTGQRKHKAFLTARTLSAR